MQPWLSASQPRSVARVRQITGASGTSAASAVSLPAAVAQSPNPMVSIGVGIAPRQGTPSGHGNNGGSSRSSNGMSLERLSDNSISTGSSCSSEIATCNCNKARPGSR